MSCTIFTGLGGDYYGERSLDLLSKVHWAVVVRAFHSGT